MYAIIISKIINFVITLFCEIFKRPEKIYKFQKQKSQEKLMSAR